MSRLLIVVDPGLVSGVCVVDADTLQKLESAELGVEETEDWLWAQLDKHWPSVPDVVAEDFRITPQTGKHSQATWSLELKGSIKYIARMHRLPAIFQTSADAKTFTSNDKLRKLGWWHKGGAGHANDALRHAALRLVRTGCTDRTLLGLD